MSAPPIPPKPVELQGEPLAPAPAPSSVAAPRPVNTYIRRLAGTPKACYVCHRPSPVVLVSLSLPNEDFFYACASHLSDRHFATRLASPAPPPAKPTVSQDEIERIKKEYEAKLAKKNEGTDKDKDKKDASWLGSAVGTVGSLASAVASIAAPAPVDTAAASSSSAAPSAAPPPPGTHERYALDRGYFAMRVELWKKREAAKRMRALHLPSAPR